MPYTLHHVKTPESFNAELAKGIYSLMNKERDSIRSPLRANYTPANLDIESHLIFSCVTENSSIIAFCGIYNGGRYPTGVYRILNRSFIASQGRTLGLYDCFLSRHILPEQLSRTKHLLDTIFVSRPGLSGKPFLEFWKTHCAPKDLQWSISTERVHVAPRGVKRDCYQYICSTGLRKPSWVPQTISESEWLKLEST